VQSKGRTETPPYYAFLSRNSGTEHIQLDKLVPNLLEDTRKHTDAHSERRPEASLQDRAQYLSNN